MRIVLAIVGVLLLAGCGGGTTRSDGRTSVVAAFYPLAWAAQQVGGSSVDVRNLIPPGADPHDYELGPRDVAALQRADVVLYLSHGFQPAVEDAVAGAAGRKVDVLAGLHLRAGVGNEKTDPHVWLDPVLFARIVRRIGGVLHEPRRARAVAADVLRLDAAYRRGLAHCARRDVVTTHAAFGYLAARYRLRQVAITGVDPESEPSARRLGELAALVRAERLRIVFFEPLASSSLAATIAREAGARIEVLDPIEGLTSKEAHAGDTYLTVMRRNLAVLRGALGCR